MSLRGDLRTMPLPDVLQWVGTGRKTGTLHVERRSVQKRIILREGVVFSSWSNDPRESLGQFLIRLRLVSEEQLFRALLAQEEKGRLLGSILVGDRILAEDDLRRALKAKAEETIYDLFLWPSGQFEFREGEFPDNIHITFETPVTPVILEGIRRVDEWQRIRTVFSSMDTTFKAIVQPSAVADAVDRQLLGFAAAGRSLAEMSLELRRSDFETAALLFDMHARGLVAANPVHGDGSVADPVGAIQALLTLAYQRLQERRYDAALKAYEDVLVRRPAQPEREEGSHRDDGGPQAREAAARGAARQGAPRRRRLPDADPREARPAGGLRPLARQRRVGRAVDPQALPDGRGGGDADLRPPPRPQPDRAFLKQGGAAPHPP